MILFLRGFIFKKSMYTHTQIYVEASELDK